MSDQDSNLAWGVAGIARKIERSERATYHLLARGLIPAVKVGGTWVAKNQELADPTCWPRKKSEAK
jgi:hypothetical protein